MADTSTAAILLVDDDPSIGPEIMAFLTDRHYAVEWVDNGEKAFNRLDSRLFDAVVAELNVAHRGDGLRLMAVAKERNPEVCVIFIADHPDIELATEAMRQGAYDFQTKPINLGKLEAVIQRGIEHQRLVLAQYELTRRLDEQYGLNSLIGNSRLMHNLYNAVRKIAPAETPVLLRGESGSGKDLIAQAIHNNSPRRNEPFVKIHCAGLEEPALESAVFGHAADGILFLDEIGELDPELRPQLTSLVGKNRYLRSRDRRLVRVNVRIIAATRAPLKTATFGEDLIDHFRPGLIEIPPLRERREDIPLLVRHFLQETSHTAGAPPPEITRNAMDLLMRYPWPGNIRELKSTMEGMALMATGSRPIGVNNVPENIRRDATAVTGELRIPVGSSMKEIERTVIEETLKACEYNKEKCAATLGIGLRTLYRKLGLYEIR